MSGYYVHIDFMGNTPDETLAKNLYDMLYEETQDYDMSEEMFQGEIVYWRKPLIKPDEVLKFLHSQGIIAKIATGDEEWEMKIGSYGYTHVFDLIMKPTAYTATWSGNKYLIVVGFSHNNESYEERIKAIEGLEHFKIEGNDKHGEFYLYLNHSKDVRLIVREPEHLPRIADLIPLIPKGWFFDNEHPALPTEWI